MSRSLRLDSVPEDTIVYYGESGSIPSRYTAQCVYYCKYLRGTAACACPGSCVGEASHTHTCISHNNAICPTSHGCHSHGACTITTTCFGTAPVFTGTAYQQVVHTHTTTSGSTTCGSFTVPSVGHTHTSLSNDPGFKTAVPIKNTSSTIGLRLKFLPVDSLIIWPNTESVPDGYIGDTRYDCTYVKAKVTVGCTGGSDGHTHDCISHNHVVTVSGHTHTTSSINSGGTNQTIGRRNVAGTNAEGGQAHTHLVGCYSFDSNTGCGSTSTTDGGHTHGSLNKEPSFLIARMIKYSTISLRLTGIINKAIVEWDGILSSIPTGFQVADGTNGTTDARGRYFKFQTSCIGTTGGADSHTHSCNGGHTHTVTVIHNHPTTGNTGTASTSVFPALTTESGGNLIIDLHKHPASSGGSNDKSTASCLANDGAHTHGSKTHLPSSKEVVHIEKLI